MYQRAHVGRERMFGRFIGFLGIAALCVTLCLTPSAFAQTMGYGEKGLYYGGQLWEFSLDLSINYTTSNPHLILKEWYGCGGSETYSYWDWGAMPNIVGSLGACVFKGLLHCFFTLTDGTLSHVTFDPASQQMTGPTTITRRVNNPGAAAAVFQNQIYVFVSNYQYNDPYNDCSSLNLTCFSSIDGSQFFMSGEVCIEIERILDAVTFYPMDDNPGGILLVFNSPDPVPQKLRSVEYYPTGSNHVDAPLPWPPAAPYLWQQVIGGNLVLGTNAGDPVGTAGAKAPSVQFYGTTLSGQDGQHQGRWEYNLTNHTWTFYNWTWFNSNTIGLFAAPSAETVDTQKGTMRFMQCIGVQYKNAGGYYETQFYSPSWSDWMVPQNNDPTYGWAGTPTATADMAGTELQNLWTLVGVVLGPPPFAMNGLPSACGPLAWADYGKDLSTTVSTTSTSSSTISVASNSKIKGGIGELSLDLSYAHGWNSSHGTSQTVSVSQDFQFSPCSETGTQGIHGWAIFNAPTLVTQWYKLYAYDYDQSSGAGTYLNQDIYATALGAVVQQTAYFELAKPSQGEYTGLFAGMHTYPNSTDIAGWHLNIPNWDNGGSDWTAVFGDTTSPQMPVLNLGVNNNVSYTKTNTTMDSKGNSNSFDVTAGAKLTLAGFSEQVTVGYDGTWTTTTENESTITENVTCGLNVPIPPDNSPPNYIKSMTVQPFWLQAKTSNAPWLPKVYGDNLPWCMTWAVTQYQTVGGNTSGLAAAPEAASGTIRHGKGMGKDTYSLTGGYLAWLNAGGTEKTMSLTADEFDPSQGASVSLNGHVFSADETHGKWVRKGDVWKYRTRGGTTADSLTLELNFANRTWSFTGSSQTLDQEIHTADKEMRVVLDIQGTFRFATWLKHDVDTSWSYSEEESTWQPYGVHELEGAYDSRTGVGNLKLQGHIPRHVSSFGDLEIRVNGASVAIPLLPLEGFQHALKRGRSLKYKAEGLSFEINFGTGKWKATFAGDQFKGDMAPRSDAIRVQVLLGGRTISDQTFVIQRHTTVLSFNAR